MREQAFFQTGQKDVVEFQPLGSMDGHQLHGILPGLCLVVTGLERGVGQESQQGRDDLAGLRVGQHVHRSHRRGQADGDGAGGLVHRQGHGVFAKALLGHKGLGGIDQFVQVLQAVLAVLFVAVEVAQARGVEHMLDDLPQRQTPCGLAHGIHQGHKALQVGPGLAGHGGHAL